jgi:hypothetical protein
VQNLATTATFATTVATTVFALHDKNLLADLKLCFCFVDIAWVC